jgi:hypothetical protein
VGIFCYKSKSLSNTRVIEQSRTEEERGNRTEYGVKSPSLRNCRENRAGKDKVQKDEYKVDGMPDSGICTSKYQAIFARIKQETELRRLTEQAGKRGERRASDQLTMRQTLPLFNRNTTIKITSTIILISSGGYVRLKH